MNHSRFPGRKLWHQAAFLLLAWLATASGFAATISLGNGSAFPGGQVTLTISLTGDGAVTRMDQGWLLDTNRFSLFQITVLSHLTESCVITTGSEIRITTVTSPTPFPDGPTPLCDVTLRVGATTPPGVYTFQGTNGTCTGGAPGTCFWANGSVTVLSSNTPPALSYNPSSTIQYPASGAGPSISVSNGGGGSGSGSAATTTLTNCSITGGSTSFPTTSFNPNIVAVGSGVPSPNSFALPACAPQSAARAATLSCSESRAGSVVTRSWTLNCPAFSATPPTLAFNPGTGSTIAYPAGGAGPSITVSNGGGGAGSGSAATTTLTSCSIVGGDTSFPTTSFNPNIVAVGTAAPSPSSIFLPACSPQSVARLAALTCSESRAGSITTRSWTLNCPALSTAPPALAFSPGTGSTIAYPPSGAGPTISVANSGGGAGSGSGATTTLTNCAITGGSTSFPTTSFNPNIVAVGTGAPLPSSFSLPACSPQSAARTANLSCSETRAGSTTARSWNLSCPGGSTAAPALGFNPATDSTIAYPGDGAGQFILVSNDGGGFGSGSGATTTLTNCSITGGGASFPITAFNPNIVAVGSGTPSPFSIPLPVCSPQSAARSATLACAVSRAGSASTRSWNLNCPAFSGTPGMDEPAMTRFPLPVPNPANANCPAGFFIAAVEDGPGAGLVSGIFGVELLLDEPGTRLLAGGLNFGGLIDAGQPGFAGFNFTNAANEMQRVVLNLTGSPASSSTGSLPVRVRIIRQTTAGNQPVFETTRSITLAQPFETSINLTPGFYVATVEPTSGTVGGAAEGQFFFGMSTSFIGRAGGGFQGGAVVGGYHAEHPFGGVSGFAAFCLGTQHASSIRVLSRPTYGPTGARDLRLRVLDAQQSVVTSTPITLLPKEQTLAVSVSVGVVGQAWGEYAVDVPAGARDLRVTVTNEREVDLYLRFGSPPTPAPAQHDCRGVRIGPPNVSTDAEGCQVPTPAAGRHYVRVYPNRTGQVNFTIQANWDL